MHREKAALLENSFSVRLIGDISKQIYFKRSYFTCAADF